MAVSDTYVFPGFLTPVLTLLFLPKPPTTFLTFFCRGERRKYAGKKSRLNRGSPLSHPGGAKTKTNPAFYNTTPSNISGVLRGSVGKCLTRSLWVLGSSRAESSWFFVGMSLGTTLGSPSLVLVKPRKHMNNVSCRRDCDMTEILLKAA